VSAFFSPHFRQMLEKHGISDVFEKPIDIKHIANLLV
jgi:hypothetical protein